MATVYLVTAGSGDSYHIERVYLDGDQAYGFAQDYNGMAPIEPVQVEEWQSGAPPGAYDGPYWRAEWWARVPVSKRRVSCGKPALGNASTTSPSAKNGGPETPCRTPRWCAGNWPGYRGSRWWVVQGEGGGTVLGDGDPGQGRVGRGTQEMISARSRKKWKEIGHSDSTLPLWCGMMPAWIHALWNGWAITS